MPSILMVYVQYKGIQSILMVLSANSGLYPAILGKGTWLKLRKNDQLNVKNWEKLSTQNIIGSKIYRKNQVILDYFLPSTSV